MNGMKIRSKRQRQSERSQQISDREARLLERAHLNSPKVHEVTSPASGTRFIRLREMPSTSASTRAHRSAYVCP